MSILRGRNGEILLQIEWQKWGQQGQGGVSTTAHLGLLSWKDEVEFSVCLFHVKENIHLSRKSWCQVGAAVNKASSVSKRVMNVRPAGENGSSSPHIPCPAGSKDINVADWLPNGPWKTLK